MGLVDLLLTAISATCLVLTARLVAASLRPRGWVLYAQLVVVVAWAELVAILLLLSPMTQVRTWPFVGGLGLALAAATLIWLRLGRPAAPSRRPALTAARMALRDPAIAALATVVVLAGLYVLALALFTRPLEWDGLSYHLPRAALWLQQHAVAYIDGTSEPRLNANPPGAELGILATMLVSGGDRLVNLPQIVSYGTLVLGTVGIARRIGLPTNQALVGGLFVASLPVIAVQAPTPYNDLVVASFLVAAAYALLGDTPADRVLLVLAVALALTTKFTAIFALPVLVVMALTRPSRRTRLATVGLGALLGTSWYLVNLLETGHADGALATATGQTQPFALEAIAPTFRKYVYAFVDFSGTRGLRYPWLLTAVAVAVAGIGIACSLARRSRRAALVGLGAAATIVFPLALVWMGLTFLHVWVKGWLVLGREDIARADSSWQVQTSSDAALSWFGPVAAILLVVGTAVVTVRVARGRLPLVAAVLALSPILFLAVFATLVPWDPWRGRFVIFAVACGAATWGVVTVIRPVVWGSVALVAVTLPLALAGMLTKPSGAEFTERDGESVPSVWRTDERELLARLNAATEFVRVLNAVDRAEPATVAAALRPDDFLYTLFDHRQKRRVRVLPPTQGSVPSDADLLVLAPGIDARRCGTWDRVYDTGGWIVERKVSPDGPCTTGR